VVEPIGAIELTDFGEGHVLDRHLINGRNKPVYVPCIEPAATRPKVILLPHVPSVARQTGARLVGTFSALTNVINFEFDSPRPRLHLGDQRRR
jgi:hypothetical protein